MFFQLVGLVLERFPEEYSRFHQNAEHYTEEFKYSFHSLLETPVTRDVQCRLSVMKNKRPYTCVTNVGTVLRRTRPLSSIDSAMFPQG